MDGFALSSLVESSLLARFWNAVDPEQFRQHQASAQIYVGGGVRLGSALAGLVFLVVGLWFGWRSLSFSFGTVEVDGQVVEMQTTAGGRGKPRPHAVVRYFVDNREYRVAAKSNVKDYAIGDAVRVLYRSEQPQEAQLNHFADRWFGPLLASVFGLSAITTGGISAWRTIRDGLRKKRSFVCE